MRPVVDRLRQTYESKINFISYNANDTAAAEPARQFGITAVPTFLFFDSRGKQSEMLVGAQDEQSLVTKLDGLTSK